MSDYISIHEAIAKINERAREKFTLASGYEYYLGALHDVADDLRQMSTIDAVPVVRCKDCKFYWKNMKDNINEPVPACLASPKIDAFCSEGERKEE